MTQPSDPHDKLFRALLDDPERARALLVDHLPAGVVAELAETLPVPEDGTFVDERLRGSQSDRLFRVELARGGFAFIYTLLEHKSQPDPRTPIQVLSYMARIWDRYLGRCVRTPAAMPAIVPMVLYHGRAPWTVPTSMAGWLDAPAAIREQVADFGYVLRELGPIPDAELARHRAVRGVLMALKHARERGVPVELVVSLVEQTPDGSLLELQVVEYVGRVYDMTRAELETAVRQAKPHRWEEIMGTPAEEWIEEGKQRGKAEGRAEGKAEGMAQGRAEAVLRILRGRFGEPDARLAERIRSADLDVLDAMLDLALTVEKPDDVIRGTGQH